MLFLQAHLKYINHSEQRKWHIFYHSAWPMQSSVMTHAHAIRAPSAPLSPTNITYKTHLGKLDQVTAITESPRV